MERRCGLGLRTRISVLASGKPRGSDLKFLSVIPGTCSANLRFAPCG
jgi:hypothetical protein